MTRNAWNMRRWWDNLQSSGVDPASGFLGLCSEPAPLGTPRPVDAPCGTPNPEDPGEPPTGSPSTFARADHELSDPTAPSKPVRRTLAAQQLALPDLGCYITFEQRGLTVRGLLSDFHPEDPILIFSVAGGCDAVLGGVYVRVDDVGSHESVELTLDPTTTIHLTRIET